MFTSELIAGTGSSAVSLDLITEIPISLNLSIADIREPEKRNGAFSKTIKLKGTKLNNKFFEHTYQVNVATNSWNPNIKSPATILQGGAVVFKGYLRLFQISVVLVNGENDIEYEISIFGDNNTLFANIGDSKLEDLDLSTYDHVYSRENIVKSWATSIKQGGVDVAFAYGNGYFYPLIDYGHNAFLTNSFPVEVWRPAFYEKTYVDAIFSDAGKTYTSNFFNSSFFKKQFIPHNGDKFTMSAANLALREFYAGDTGASSAQNHTLSVGAVNNWWLGQVSTVLTPNTLDCKFNDDTTSPFIDTGNIYNTSTGVITIGQTGNYNLTAKINWEIKLNAPAGTVTIFNGTHPYHYKLLKSTDGGTTWTIASTQFINDNTALSTSYASISYTFAHPTSTFNAGEKYKFVVNALVNSTTTDLKFLDGASSPIVTGSASTDARLKSNATLSLKLANSNYTAGQTISVNDAIPKDYKQKDFLTSLFKKYNLYVDIDKNNPDNYIIETRDDFYAAGTTKDWSSKLAWDKPMVIKPTGEVDWKTLLYQYRQDNDYFNKQYQDRYLEAYGSYKKLTVNDFTSKENKTELIFSPTPVVDNPNNPMIIPKIFEYDGTNVKPMKHNIRSLMYNGTKSLSVLLYSFNSPVSDIYGPANTSFAVFPECAMVSNATPSTSTQAPLAPDESIEFGIPNEVYYTLGTNYTDNNLFNRFYSKQINEITDRDAKIVTAYVKLEPHDISQFDFRDTIYLKDAYYYVNKIMDYNPLEDELTKVEFIKIKQYDSFVATTPAIAIAETGIGNIGMSSNRFGSEPGRTISGDANNLLVGSNVGSRSIGSVLNGTNIYVDVSCERISTVNCNDIAVFNGVSGAALLNSSGIYLGASTHDINLINCNNVSIEDLTYSFTGIGINDTTITNSKSNTVEIGTQMSGDSSSYLMSNVYTPTLTNVTNITASEAFPCTYMRVGNTVTVSGKVDIDQTSPGAIELGISLPIASTFTNDYQCSGTGIGIASGDDPMYIQADVVNSRASLISFDTDTTNHSHFFHFTYRII